jgi:high affinity Mn2+ porin
MRPIKCVFFILNFLLLLFSCASAQQNNALLKDSGWSYHFQLTGILQEHPSINAPYSGQNSLLAENEKAYSVTSTLFLGRKLWKGASLYFNAEMAGGSGISSTLGIAGFPNGETFRIGDAQPVVYVARFFLHQNISLDKDNMVVLEDDVNQVKEKVSASRISFSLGKFGIADFFDGNSVSHDPRNDFMNWALMNNGAYDYAANTRGYTYAFVAEYIKAWWSLRFGTALMPKYANGPKLDFNYFKTNSETIEFEKRYLWHQRKGAIRILGFYNVSKAPNYEDVVAAKMNGTDTSLDVIYGKEYGGKKIGFGINAEQELGNIVNAFFRFGWNDGKTATWAFAEIDNSVSVGIRVYGKGWKRVEDNFGIAFLSNGISSGHRDFLKAGGYGFMIGDGKLPNYAREDIAEIFYQSKIFNNLWASVDYQFVNNPAYNRDRGPAHVFAARISIRW